MKNSRRRRQGADPVRRIFPLLESLAETSIDLNLPRDALVELLKTTLLQIALRKLADRGDCPTAPAIALVSGMKDPREVHSLLNKKISEEAFLPFDQRIRHRWSTDPRFRDPSGNPLPLPRRGSGTTFENLVRTTIGPRMSYGPVLKKLIRDGYASTDARGRVTLSRGVSA
ncbi:MAG: DUF6502 family protein [Xanthomonadales bacterium]|nr:DUF6502 family protein [Xanthomonadales bacterium]